MGIIYVATNSINNKKYVGKTKRSLEERVKQHLLDSRKGAFCFHKALVKYGENAFTWEVVDYADCPEELAIKEQQWIEKLHTYLGDPECLGYNMTTGGEGDNPVVYDQELRSKLSKSAKKRCTEDWVKARSGSNHYLYGKHPSDESRLKMSLASKGKPKTDSHKSNISKGLKDHTVSKDTKQKISKALSGNNHPKFGKKDSADTVEKKRASAHKGANARNAKKVRCIETGVIYLYIKEVESMGICSTSVSACCRGRQNTAGGYHWEYIKE